MLCQIANRRSKYPQFIKKMTLTNLWHFIKHFVDILRRKLAHKKKDADVC